MELLPRKRHGELGTDSHRRNYCNLAAVQPYEMLDDRKAQACAAELAGTSGIGSIKPFEDARKVFRSDPIACIDDDQSVHCFICAVRYRNISAFSIEFYRVAQ